MSDVNRKIAELLGYYIYHYDKDYPARCYYMLSVPNDCHWAGWDQLRFRNEWGQWNAGERKTEKEAWNDAPDCKNDLIEAIEAARELLTSGFSVGWNDESGWFVIWDDGESDDLQELNPDNMEALPAAICAAILQAHGVTVEVSE